MDKLRLSRIPLMMFALLLVGCGVERESGTISSQSPSDFKGELSYETVTAHLSPLLFNRRVGTDFVIFSAQIYDAPADVYINYSEAAIWSPLQPYWGIGDGDPDMMTVLNAVARLK